MLLEKRAEILPRLNVPDGWLGYPGHVAEDDQAPISHEVFVSLEMNRISYNLFKLVEDALARIERGDYGTCMRCGRPIPPKRLKAIPWASNCIACEEEMSPAPDMHMSPERVAETGCDPG